MDTANLTEKANAKPEFISLYSFTPRILYPFTHEKVNVT